MTPRMHAILLLSLLPLLAAKAPTLFTPAELDTLLAPIALYPDPLLAQTLPAATTPLDLVEAVQWLRDTPAPTEQGIDAQPWSPAVRILTHYPKVLHYLTDNIAWTRQLGDAYANQRAAVNQSIQRLRTRARLAGNLPSSPEQTIIQEPNTLSIQPAQPDVIYIPVYDPVIIYTHRHPPHFEDPCPTAPLLAHNTPPQNPTPPTPDVPASFSASADPTPPEIISAGPRQETISISPTPAPAPAAPAPQASTPQPTPAPAAEQFRSEPQRPEPTTSVENGRSTVTR